LDSQMWVNSRENSGVTGQDGDRNGIIDDVHGANFCNSLATGNTQDEPVGHGTMVAGVVGAKVNNGRYVAGVHRTAKLMAIKFICNDANEGPVGTTDGAMSAVMYAIEKKAKIINASWTIGSSAHTGLRMAIELADRVNGSLFVAAAGNSSMPPPIDIDTTRQYPASYG